METIFAESTAPGRAGVSVIRVSGVDVPAVMQQLCGTKLVDRAAELCPLKAADGQIIDSGICLFFEGPRSFTGEDVLELQVHGSISVVDALLARLGEFPNCRSADAGEFTRRALLNGKMDLIAVEGLADLIDAETEQQRLLAQSSLSGKFREFVDWLRDTLIRSAALLEATIDFADEEIPEDVSDEVLELLASVTTGLKKQLDGIQFAERLRTGFEVAIVGAPNVGKSTLLNALAGRDAAITSSVAGTTRDVIEVRMNLDGIPVTVLDTAGLRETDDPVESVGVQRAMSRADAADIRVFLMDDGERIDLEPRPDDIVKIAKGDLRQSAVGSVSGLTGEGLDDLVVDLSDILKRRVSLAGLASRDRHRRALTVAAEHVETAQHQVLGGVDQYDIAAEEIRSAVRRLDALVGRVDVENLLDVIFSSFCVGK